MGDDQAGNKGKSSNRMEKAEKPPILVYYLDSHGVITLSSGPPISTILFSLVNPSLNPWLLLFGILLFIYGKNCEYS